MYIGATQIYFSIILKILQSFFMIPMDVPAVNMNLWTLGAKKDKMLSMLW